MTLPRDDEVKEILYDYAYAKLCRWIPNQCRDYRGSGSGDPIDWGQVCYLRKEAIEEFVEWNLKMLSKGINPEGSRKTVPYNWTGYWEAIRRATLAFYDNRCFTCGGPAEEVHHVRPREYGGTDHPSNLIPLCTKCHKEVHRRLESSMRFAFSSSIQGMNRISMEDFA